MADPFTRNDNINPLTGSTLTPESLPFRGGKIENDRTEFVLDKLGLKSVVELSDHDKIMLDGYESQMDSAVGRLQERISQLTCEATALASADRDEVKSCLKEMRKALDAANVAINLANTFTDRLSAFVNDLPK